MFWYLLCVCWSQVLACAEHVIHCAAAVKLKQKRLQVTLATLSPYFLAGYHVVVHTAVRHEASMLQIVNLA